MTNRIVCRIGGVDYGSAGQNLLMSLDSVSPMGPGGVGTATIGLRKAGGGITITNQQVVELYEQEIGTNKIPRSYVMGIVNRRRTGVMRGTNIKVWAIDTVDANDALDGIVGNAIVPITVSSGTFTAQIASIYTQAVSAGTPTVPIDYVSGILDPTGGATLPAVTFKGRTLRAMIQDRCNELQKLNPALRMKFHIGPDTNPNRTTFGGPILYTYDAASSAPSIALWFTDTPAGGKVSIAQAVEFGRVIEGAKLIQKRQILVKATGNVWLGQSDPAVITTYRYPYSGDGARWGELVEDSQSLNDTDGQYAIARAVRSTGTPRETIQLSAYAYALPGQYAKLDWALEGLAGAIYSIAAVSVDFRNWRNPLTTFTLGARRLMLGENPDLDELVMPVERDRIPPATPVNWRESPASTYSQATRMSTVNVTFDGPQETDLDYVGVSMSINGVIQPLVRLARGTLTLAVLMAPGATWQAQARAWDTTGNYSAPTAIISGTAAAYVAEVPGPPATVTLSGVRSGQDTWTADVSWSAGTGGTGTASQYDIRYYKTASGSSTARIVRVPIDTRQWSIPGLIIGTGYTINVRSVTAYGDVGGWSTGSTLTFNGETPGAPTISSVSSAKGAITFNIGKPTTGTGLTNIDRYAIGMAWYNGATLLGKEERIVSYNGDPTGAAWMGVELGATYKFTVTALTKFGDVGTASAQSTYIVPSIIAVNVNNADFEEADYNNPSLPAHWTRTDVPGTSGSWDRYTGDSNSGLACLRVTHANTLTELDILSEPFIVEPGATYQLTGYVKGSSVNAVGGRVEFHFYDKTGTEISFVASGSINVTASWTSFSVTSAIVAPAGSVQGKVLLANIGKTAPTPDPTWVQYWDSLYLRRMIGTIDVIDDTVTASKIVAGAINSPTKFGSAMAAVQKGTSNPGSPASGDTVFRSDLGRIAYYDGTRFLNVAPELLSYVLTSGNATPFPNTLAANTGVYVAVKQQAYAWLHERCEIGWYVNTTNNASNYWTIAVVAVSSSGARTILASINTSAAAANTYNVTSITSFASNPTTATGAVWIQIELTKTGTPGSIYMYPQHTIREVIV